MPTLMLAWSYAMLGSLVTLTLSIMKFSTVVTKTLLIVLLSAFTSSVFAKGNFRTFNVVLLQPEAVLTKRVPDVGTLASYIKELEQALAASIEPVPSMEVAGGFVVVGIKPGSKSTAWLDFRSGISPRTQNILKNAVSSVKPPSYSGLVLFALKVGINGGAQSIELSPAPAEWKIAADKLGRTVEVETLVETMWTD
ncbi:MULTISPECIES: hypothetical protein [Undibacterium]|uniref:Uncharacterized protein n=1 Tax=Undibacterium umbellatum TaxID=2762300 RepID=A0ABR6ZG42_9BURK|nr:MULTISPECIES: hypothetical protein [Undibacterium]MBC3910648.1 hypothetical protein [Undibacterium umbellatum]MDP1976336.1 hypothetical protein [Undibacterium sp.]